MQPYTPCTLWQPYGPVTVRKSMNTVLNGNKYPWSWSLQNKGTRNRKNNWIVAVRNGHKLWLPQGIFVAVSETDGTNVLMWLNLNTEPKVGTYPRLFQFRNMNKSKLEKIEYGTNTFI